MTVTVSGELVLVPSLTTRLTTYAPATSAVNEGVAVVAPVSAAPLPTGTLSKAHW